jgi:deaminated glutathione amidase
MSERTLRAACVQMRSSENVQENIRAATALIREAAGKGARFVATPENTSLMAKDGGAKLEKTFAEKDDPALPVFVDLANALNIWLLVGSLAIKMSDTHTANRSFLIGPDGRIEARYDKIHLFDVDLPSGESYRESNTVAPGEEAEVAALPWGRVGFTICYDVRFPQLYRTLAKAGAEIITVPSAFTVPTGEAHWQVLLRARAIENACFIVAPAQGGTHANGRKTYGHSLIAGPWGEILAEAGTDPGVIVADLDLDEIARVRSRLPALRHDRPFRSA